MGSGTVETQRLRTRNYLTYDLGLALALTGMASAFFVIDALAHELHQWQVAGSMTYAKAFAGLIAAIMAAMPTARMLAGFLDDRSTGRPSAFVRVLKRDLVAAPLFTIFGFTWPRKVRKRGHKGWQFFWETNHHATQLLVTVEMVSLK